MTYVVDGTRSRDPADEAGSGESDTYTTAGRPGASEWWAARPPIIVKDPGEPAQYQKCLPTSDGGFEWVVLQQSS